MVRIMLRRGTVVATGSGRECDTYLECDDGRETHVVVFADGEHVGALRFAGPSWELRPEFHCRVRAISD